MAATRLSFSYPEEMKEELMKLAKADSRTLSSYVQTILADHLDKNKLDKPQKRPRRKRSAKAQH